MQLLLRWLQKEKRKETKNNETQKASEYNASLSDKDLEHNIANTGILSKIISGSLIGNFNLESWSLGCELRTGLGNLNKQRQATAEV